MFINHLTDGQASDNVYYRLRESTHDLLICH